MKKKALPFLLAGAALLAMTACSRGSATNQSETPTSSTGSVTSSVEQASSQSTAAASSVASSASSEQMVIMLALKEPGRMLLATSLFWMTRAWFQVFMNCTELL